MRLTAATAIVAVFPLLIPPARSGAKVSDAGSAGPTSTAIAPAGGRFAQAVAVAGSDILVGSTELSAFRGVNGVHVFRRTAPTRWTDIALLTPNDSAASPRFGALLSADGPLLAVGDPGAAKERGAVYIFERNGRGRWLQRAKLTLDSTATAGAAEGARLGTYLMLRAGLLVVEVSGQMGSSGVAVFRRGADAGQWTEQRVVTPAGAEQFGATATIAGGRLVVSAPGAPTASRRLGRLYVLRDSAGTWVAETTIDAPDDTLAARAIPAIAGFRQGQLLGDGTDLWVGYPGAEQGHGAVLHFRRAAAGTWTQVGRLVTEPPDTLPNLGFGLALVRAGDDLVAGLPAADTEAGVLQIFRRDRADSLATWRARQRLGMTPPVAWAALGSQLAAAGNLLVAIAPRAGLGQGAVVVFERHAATGTWRERTTLVPPLPAALAHPIRGPLPCTAGTVRGFDCANVELLSFLPLPELGAKIAGSFIPMTLNDMWGWTDSATGREFALVGRVDGTAFVEVTDPTRPKYLGELPLHPGAHPSPWRDIKVYQHHAFVVSDQAGPHGMQVFDLTQLLHVKLPPVIFRETAHYDGIATAHNLVIDTATGFAYAVSSNGSGETCGGQLHMIDIRDPRRPIFAGCQTEPKVTGVHDAQCVVYHGPDRRYAGREICFNSAGSALVLADVTDKQHPQTISIATYPNVGYTHQGWLTEDQRYFVLDDENDPGDDQGHTRTIVFDLSELADPVVAKDFFGAARATAHNLYIRGGYAYLSNYKAGLRVVDIRDPKDPREIGYLDTTPGEENGPGFAGSWSNYPYFRSGAVGVVSMAEGLFLVRPRLPKS